MSAAPATSAAPTTAPVTFTSVSYPYAGAYGAAPYRPLSFAAPSYYGAAPVIVAPSTSEVPATTTTTTTTVSAAPAPFVRSSLVSYPVGGTPLTGSIAGSQYRPTSFVAGPTATAPVRSAKSIALASFSGQPVSSSTTTTTTNETAAAPRSFGSISGQSYNTGGRASLKRFFDAPAVKTEAAPVIEEPVKVVEKPAPLPVPPKKVEYEGLVAPTPVSAEPIYVAPAPVAVPAPAPAPAPVAVPVYEIATPVPEPVPVQFVESTPVIAQNVNPITKSMRANPILTKSMKSLGTSNSSLTPVAAPVPAPIPTPLPAPIPAPVAAPVAVPVAAPVAAPAPAPAPVAAPASPAVPQNPTFQSSSPRGPRNPITGSLRSSKSFNSSVNASTTANNQFGF